MKTLKPIFSDQYLECILQHMGNNNNRIAKEGLLTFQRVSKNGISGTSKSLERMAKAKAPLHTIRGSRSTRIVGLKKDGHFIFLHVDKHDEAQKWAERQPADPKYEERPMQNAAFEHLLTQAAAEVKADEQDKVEEIQSSTKEKKLADKAELLAKKAEAERDEVYREWDQAEARADQAEERAAKEADRANKAEAEREHAFEVAANIEDSKNEELRKYSAIISSHEDTILDFENMAQNTELVPPSDQKPISGFSQNEVLEDAFVLIDKEKRSIALKFVDNPTLRLNNWKNGFDDLLNECRKLVGCRVQTDVWGGFSPDEWFQNIYLISSERRNSTAETGTRSDKFFFTEDTSLHDQKFDSALNLWFTEKGNDNTPNSSRATETKGRIYLNCPFEEKEECKELGGYWDNEVRKWYIPDGMPTKPFERWIENNSGNSLEASVKDQNNEPRVYLDCPFSEKEECKAVGGKWDNDKRKWYIPQGISTDKFSKWLPKIS
jgi:hypothetical protein